MAWLKKSIQAFNPCSLHKRLRSQRILDKELYSSSEMWDGFFCRPLSWKFFELHVEFFFTNTSEESCEIAFCNLLGK